jgi:uncharacterized membrane-anchored protein YitT (DUF2179 family)
VAHTADWTSPPPAVVPHTWFEDALAFVSAAALASLGIAVFAQAHLLTGGTAGLALLLSYHTPLSFGAAMLLVNAPFLALGLWWKGWGFVARSTLAVVLLAGLSELQRVVLVVQIASPLWSAVLGGLLVSVSLLMLFRHRASLGGVNVLSLLLQDKLGWRAGWVQLAIDAGIVLAAFGSTSWQLLVASLLGALVLNASLALNHRPGRYIAV